MPVIFASVKTLSLPKFNLKLFNMRIRGLVVIVSIIALLFGSCARNAVSKVKLKNEIDSVSYAFGIINYNALMNDDLSLNPLAVARAMWDGEKGKPGMSDDAARNYIMMYITNRDLERSEKEEEMNRINYKEYIEANEAFLSKNRERQGVSVTPSGLQYEVIKMGNGPKPTINSTVRVHYVGTLIDGNEFDSSVARGAPAQFPLSGVISGWTEALQLMPVGSKFKIYLPENLAYGPNGAGDVIQPFSTLVFEVELLEIVE